MLVVLPKWYDELEKKILKTIKEVALKNGINYTLVMDSKAIRESIESICQTMWYIAEHSKPDVKQVKEMKE